MSTLRPSSTVLLLRDGSEGPEVFLVRRHEATVFMGGAHVFPGGAVDAADWEADPSWCDGLASAAAQLPMLRPEEAAALHVAAVRELFEEAGVLLARDGPDVPFRATGDAALARLTAARHALHAGHRTMRAVASDLNVRLALDTLVLSGHWVTPPAAGHRFDTRFFVARMPEGQEPAHDAMETTEGGWFTATGALAAAARDEILLPPPTWTSLREIRDVPSVEAILAWARGLTVQRRESQVFDDNGVRTLVTPGHPRHSDPALDPTTIGCAFVWRNKRWCPVA